METPSDTAIPNPIPNLKIAVILRDDLQTWQRINVTAFLAGGVAAGAPDLVGAPYVDADGVEYLPMFGRPVMAFEADAGALATVHRKALGRGLPLAVFVAGMFGTDNDVDNRAAVAASGTTDLDLVGVALTGPRTAVDKVVKGTHLHP